ncbi:hypothetical protein [Schleiferilactobacillus shenzhenensis]|uniref:Uncharacterized protein n=1 Tax=Schleiferilactobacillus shenzhenensis LY-73 TaxID=1231336 RepID=U4TRM3_9LACO|nr:hypothetical protein [Schleiferilactobacillus shenzhenensis]ERL64553.1 hypothetical protein L248_0848 [Schleiferilactobacillus shenzhenensis LY-73]
MTITATPSLSASVPQTLATLAAQPHPAADKVWLTPNIAALVAHPTGTLVCYTDGRILHTPQTPKQILNQAMSRTLLLSLMLPRDLMQTGREKKNRLPLPAAFGRLIYLPLGATRNNSPHFVALHHLARVDQTYAQRTCTFHFAAPCAPLTLPYWHADINQHIDDALTVGQKMWTFLQTLAQQAGVHSPRVPLSPLMKQWAQRHPDAVPDQAALHTMRDQPYYAVERLLTGDTSSTPEWTGDINRVLRRLRYY